MAQDGATALAPYATHLAGLADVLGARAGEAKELSRLLGDDHDMCVLLAFAGERGKAVLNEEELATLATTGRSIQDGLRELAKPRGNPAVCRDGQRLEGAHGALLVGCRRRLLSLAPKENGDTQHRARKPEVKARRPPH